MKLTYFQLEQQVQKKLLPVYLISGDDFFLKQDASSWIRKAAKNAGFSERLCLAPSTSSDWDELYTVLYANSLLQEKRVIELNCRDASPNKTAQKILSDYAARPSSEQILFIDFNKLDAKVTKTSWFSALETIGAHIAIWPIPREQLPTWIQNRAKKYKLHLSLDAADFLADYVEGNLSAAAQALEKIYLTRPEKSIDQTFLTNLLTDESRYTIFDLTETMLTDNKDKTLHVLKQLQLEGTEPVLILWAMTRELRILSDIGLRIQQGETYDKLCLKHKIFARRQTIVRQYISKKTPQDCWYYLHLAAEIDKTMKGLQKGDCFDQLQSLCIKLV